MARIIEAFAQFFDGSGAPLVDGFLKFNVTGTNNTDKDTFADVSETIANDNPLQLDGEGRCPNVFGTGSYNVVSFKDSIITPGVPGEQIQQFDPVGGSLDGSAFSDWNASTIYSIGDIVTGSDGNNYRSITNSNQGNDPTSSTANWEQIQLGRIWNPNVTYAEFDSAYGSDGNEYVSQASSNTGNDPTTDPAGTNWRASEFSQRTSPVATTHDLAGDSDYTLTAEQESFGRIIITDTSAFLTQARNIICSDNERGYFFQNDTTFSLTLKTSAGTGVVVASGFSTLLFCDGTNVIDPLTTSATIVRGHIDGLITSNNTTDPIKDVDTGVGECTDSTNSVLLVNNSILVKRIDASWVEGTNLGGFPSGLTLAIDTWYHYFVIAKTDGTVDAGWDTSLTATNLLADATDFSLFRRIASMLTDGSSNILGYAQDRDDFLFNAGVLDVSTSNPGTAAVISTLSTPTGIQTKANINVRFLDDSPTSQTFMLMTSISQTDATPSASAFTFITLGGGETAGGYVRIQTDESAQIRFRLSQSTADHSVSIYTQGWADNRGKE